MWADAPSLVNQVLKKTKCETKLTSLKNEHFIKCFTKTYSGIKSILFQLVSQRYHLIFDIFLHHRPASLSRSYMQTP